MHINNMQIKEICQIKSEGKMKTKGKKEKCEICKCWFVKNSPPQIICGKDFCIKERRRQKMREYYIKANRKDYMRLWYRKKREKEKALELTTIKNKLK
jgi:hypothetical protein